MTYSDTIAAIATPSGQGGIGIVRISGPDALSIAQQVFRPVRRGPFHSYRLRYGHIIDPYEHSIIDEALLAVMRKPRSFTAEDVVELSCHGGAMPLQRTLQAVLAAGARLAQPGEFTLRAFLHGRIDLSQAEATLDIIEAQTATGLALAQAQLGGWLAHEVRRIRADLLEALAAVTAVLDFPEDDVEAQDVQPQVIAGLQTVEQLLQSADQGMVYRQGARAVLVGRPNVGKSSLLNALLRTNRAIVTPIPGTTRDTLEETVNLAGIPVVLVDTAGMTESDDPVERLGIERSAAALAMADLALLVLDQGSGMSDADRAISQLTRQKTTILVCNKADIQPATDILYIEDHPHLYATVLTSATTGQGLEQLVQTMKQALLGKHQAGFDSSADLQLVTNPRHRDALSRAATSLQRIVDAAPGDNTDYSSDLLASDLTIALNALGEVTGETVGDDLLDLIFSRFCIGK
ncbi:MAG: tRNA uridine-5-carboxymethylaminomethyl(34) synthesis GTPase MnmE [Chloroflexaceae bacterium]|nr:tRNA uridine-5-carboxymethylaminomethyl(34) synthesis GTPase MnmE [Chloroflexaceae bacterium]